MVQGGKRAEREGERGEGRVCGWGARNDALIIRKRATNGERDGQQWRSAKGQQKMFTLWESNPALALASGKKNMPIHHMGYN